MDIIASKDDCLAFIEAVTRRGTNFSTFKEFVTEAKKRQITKKAPSYRQEARLPVHRLGIGKLQQ